MGGAQVDGERRKGERERERERDKEGGRKIRGIVDGATDVAGRFSVDWYFRSPTICQGDKAISPPKTFTLSLPQAGSFFVPGTGVIDQRLHGDWGLAICDRENPPLPADRKFLLCTSRAPAPAPRQIHAKINGPSLLPLPPSLPPSSPRRARSIPRERRDSFAATYNSIDRGDSSSLSEPREYRVPRRIITVLWLGVVVSPVTGVPITP